MTKKVYQFDIENKTYKGELILDDSDKSPSGAWNIPGDCVEVAPPTEKENYIPVWNGAAWVETEDYRGKEYWLPGDTYGTPGREVKEIGPLPEGAMLTPPEQKQRQTNTVKQARPLRKSAMLSGRLPFRMAIPMALTVRMRTLQTLWQAGKRQK